MEFIIHLIDAKSETIHTSAPPVDYETVIAWIDRVVETMPENGKVLIERVK